MSKGSWKRPVAVSHEIYSRNWDRIFKEQAKPPQPQPSPKAPGLSQQCPFCYSWDTTPPQGGIKEYHCETCKGFFVREKKP